MPLLYRLAASDDLPRLSRLEEECFDQDRISARSFRRLIGAASAILLVAQREDELLGYALMLLRRGSDIARLYSLAVSRQGRGQGLGGALLERCEQWARERGCQRLRLEVRLDNASAIGLYERSGYLRFARSPGFYEDGSDAWRYEKTLGTPVQTERNLA
ncbi:GNAT family N-acetyltransferase [Pseudomonas nicosulfuronedens]|uniref:GNAT family N-acetyltransferase n=1 Tax=Pseudomonas nicosulfuronedens TaxID=2571105 RepID=A0A5R9R7U1_9PSED|nr:GNAT family N-acetyltransferase [Pseudomonas nicosulfuronedens]MDH1010156.1 GNAT family N-acetyltransferase [Pseudomonas nicosulfuronedens]MDH1980172.1 GNAT family N-acetyltransferase [Pseudomonas nicosulfuronedens]MDH2025391.1 GNAT family N-acetyltransferase [Pseudomonas nicosulfuronedens]TLX78799.1 GNAT family N-acetyltransferase [Pseudomonas nicosulfuronedens]